MRRSVKISSAFALSAALLSGCGEAENVERGISEIPRVPGAQLDWQDLYYNPCLTNISLGAEPDSWEDYLAKKAAPRCEVIIETGRVALINFAEVSDEVIETLASDTSKTLHATTRGVVNIGITPFDMPLKLQEEYSEMNDDGCITPSETEYLLGRVSTLMPNVFNDNDLITFAHASASCDETGAPNGAAGLFHNDRTTSLYNIKDSLPEEPKSETTDLGSGEMTLITYPKGGFRADHLAHEVLHALGLGHDSRHSYTQDSMNPLWDYVSNESESIQVYLTDIVNAGQISEYGGDSVMGNKPIGLGYNSPQRADNYGELNPILQNFLEQPYILQEEKPDRQTILETGQSVTMPKDGEQFVTIPLGETSYSSKDTRQNEYSSPYTKTTIYDAVSINGKDLYLVDTSKSATLYLGQVLSYGETKITLEDGREITVSREPDNDQMVVTLALAA